MANHYHDAGDLKRIKELGALAPEEFKAWLALDRIVAREDGRIPRKYRELIALAVAHTTHCVYCIEVHTRAAKKGGCSKEEVAEAVGQFKLQFRGVRWHPAWRLRFAKLLRCS